MQGLLAAAILCTSPNGAEPTPSYIIFIRPITFRTTKHSTRRRCHLGYIAGRISFGELSESLLWLSGDANEVAARVESATYRVRL